MNQIVLSEIEQTVMRLSTDEQLLLISRVAEKLRRKSSPDSEFENQLVEMANDNDIQRGIKQIEKDLQYAKMDGLAKQCD